MKKISENLVFLAGSKALAHIRENGLRPKDVRVVAGAAGGPKWLVLSHLDRLLFGNWFRGRQEPLFLIGSSIGAWRFAAACQGNPVAAFDRLQEAYITQIYTRVPSPEDVTAECMRVMNGYLDDDAIKEVFRHPYLRPTIVAVRCRGEAGTDHPLRLGLGLTGAALSNVASRKLLKFFFDRALFYDPRQKPPFLGMNDFPTHRIPLTPENIREALMASGSIPMVMSGIPSVPGAPGGMYRDGGVTDYHLDIPYNLPDKEIVLFPHYTDRVIPGWLDKQLPWRKPSPENMANVLLIAPSRSFISRLPMKKIPDRKDFQYFAWRDAERIACWRAAVRECERLRDELSEVLETGRLDECVKPIDRQAR